MTIGIIFFSYLGVYLGGIGILHFSDDVLLALIAAGTFQNLLTLYVTRHFFPKIVSISDHFGNDKILNFINNYRNR